MQCGRVWVCSVGGCGCDTYQSSLRWQNFSVFVCLSNNRSTTSGLCLQREMEGREGGRRGRGGRWGEGGKEREGGKEKEGREGERGEEGRKGYREENRRKVQEHIPPSTSECPPCILVQHSPTPDTCSGHVTGM